jgi:hypothetical protein
MVIFIFIFIFSMHASILLLSITSLNRCLICMLVFFYYIYVESMFDLSFIFVMIIDLKM